MPLVGGHEGAGIVVARGDLVEDVEVSTVGISSFTMTNHARLATMSASNGSTAHV
jgi:Zn-dependent alcohol dehydrogenase